MVTFAVGSVAIKTTTTATTPNISIKDSKIAFDAVNLPIPLPF